MKMKKLFEMFLENRLYKDLFLISLGALILTVGSTFLIMRYREFSAWEHLKQAQTEKEISDMLQANRSRKFREIAMMKLSELLMNEKKFDNARYYQDILRKTASQQQLRFRAASDYAISLFFAQKNKDAIIALKEIETYSGPIPAEKRFSILLLLATASFRCGEQLSGKKYLLEILALPPSTNPKNQEIYQKANTLLKLLEKGEYK